MYCSKCGVQNSEEATLCVNCGSVLGAPVAQPAGGMEAQTCGLAIASLVMGVLSIFCSIVLALPAIICGIIALVKISKSQGQLKGNGLAIAGIAVPVVVTVVITPLMLAILMPALAKTKHIAMRVVCGTNLKGLSTAMTVYMNDYDDQYPTPENWCDLLIKEADVSPMSFQCPVAEEVEFCYAMNEGLQGFNMDTVDPATANQIVVLFEANLGKNGVGGMHDVVLRHNEHGQDGCNILFADGHVEFVTEDRIAMLKWTPEP